MFNMAANFFSDAVFSPSYRMEIDEDGFWRASVRSAAECVTTSSGDIIGDLFCIGNISILSETRYGSVLGMYDVMHQ